MSEEVSVVDAEVRPRPESEAPADWVGACVLVFTPTADPERARELAAAALDEDGYELVRIEAVLLASELGWEEDAEEYEQLIAEVAETGQVGYGPFEGWTAEEAHGGHDH